MSAPRYTTGRTTSAKRGVSPATAQRIAIGVGVVVLILLIVPRWRRATLCTLGGGKWTEGSDDFAVTVCLKKSETAGKGCTGQVRDECANDTHCDLYDKPLPGQPAGSCPERYVDYFYSQEGDFYNP